MTSPNGSSAEPVERFSLHLSNGAAGMVRPIDAVRHPYRRSDAQTRQTESDALPAAPDDDRAPAATSELRYPEPNANDGATRCV